LALPSSSAIHPIFHVSLLKRAVSRRYQVHTELLNPDSNLQIPLQVLDHRLHQYPTHTTPQVLVRWSHLPVQLSTWEDEDTLRQEFPRALAWGQAVSKGGEGVTDQTLTPATEANEGDPKVTEGTDQEEREGAQREA
jgi:hypothetical protein